MIHDRRYLSKIHEEINLATDGLDGMEGSMSGWLSKWRDRDVYLWGSPKYAGVFLTDVLYVFSTCRCTSLFLFLAPSPRSYLGGPWSERFTPPLPPYGSCLLFCRAFGSMLPHLAFLTRSRCPRRACFCL